jgi:hypothetical protein
MTTDKAFEQLLADKDTCLAIGMTETNYRQLKARYNNADSLLNLETKVKWLTRAGFQYTMKWKAPGKK